MFNIGDRVKVLFRSTKKAEAKPGWVKYATGTLRLMKNPDGTFSLGIDYDKDGTADLYNTDAFIGIKKI